ncbi:MAG TPA: peptidase M28 family protein, partial [Sphingobium sp.]
MQKIRPISSVAAMLAGLALPSAAFAASPAQMDAIRASALTDQVAMDFIEGLTTEVGPRPAGTPQEARARDWAVDKLKALGFSNVRAEPYKMTIWRRDRDEARITMPFPQSLVLAALGNSASTPARGIEGEVVYFPT